MMHQEFLDITGSRVSYPTYASKIEPQYMASDLGKEDFCKNYIEQAAKPRKQQEGKFEWDGYTHCKKMKTAYDRLTKILSEKGYPEALGYDESFIEDVASGKQTAKDLSYSDQETFIHTYSPSEFHDYWSIKDEDGKRTFFRITVEELDEGYWYIDCGFSI